MMPGRSARGGDGRHLQDVPSDTTACPTGVADLTLPGPTRLEPVNPPTGG
jgi:hypothetical protein